MPDRTDSNLKALHCRVGHAHLARAGWVWPALVLACCHAEAIASNQVLNILVDPVRTALSISDTQYSVLQGFAVAICAAILGLPAARLADLRGRRNVILFGLIAWSVATVACALVHSFEQLLVARVVVGIGEVCLFPAAFSMLADIAPPERLPIAIAIFGTGGPVGAAIALGGAGFLLENIHPGVYLPFLSAAVAQPWRVVFAVYGISGVAVVGLLLTIREPSRTSRGSTTQKLADVVRHMMLYRRAYLGVVGGIVALSFCVYATTAWTPTFLVNVHGLSYAAAGQLTGGASLVLAIFGAWGAGFLIEVADRFRSGDGPIVVCILIAGSIVSSVVAMVLVTSKTGAGAFACLVYSLLGAPTVAGGTALQVMCPPHMRAQVTAVNILLVNLIAVGLGPISVAVLTDRVFGQQSALGFAIGIVNLAAAVIAIFALVSGRAAFASLRRAAAAL